MKMKHKKRIKRSRTLADLRAWRNFVAFYEDCLEKEKALRDLTDAHKLFMEELNPLEHKINLGTYIGNYTK